MMSMLESPAPSSQNSQEETVTPNPTPIEPLAAEFPAADRAAWEALVRAKESDPDRALSAGLEDGIEVRWLYARDDELAPDPGGLTGAAPFVRGRRLGTPWAIRQQNATPDRRRANRELIEDLEGGATELLLVAGTGSGIPVSHADDLDELLDGVHLDLAPVALAADTGTIHTHTQVASALLELWRRRGHPAAEVRGSLRLDPIGLLARTGDLAPERVREETESAMRMLGEVRAEYPQVRVLGVDTTAYVEAGAGAPFELAVGLATAITYLRTADDEGIDPAAVAGALEFTLCAGPDQFLEIAKLRAARRLWAHALSQCGVEPTERRSAVYVRTSRRMVSALDPWVNLLRATTAAFAAAVAGADGITVLPFDEPVLSPGESSGPLGRRMARNTQLVLLEEASLHRVSDPAGGSWYVESLTDQLARAAWAELQAIERSGGIAEALRSGEVTRRVAGETARRHDDLARRRRSLTGVNTFPLLGDDGLERAGVDEDTALEAVPETVPDAGTLPPVRDAAQFEALRARAVRIAAEHHREPTILLACLGPLSAHVNVAQWAKSFFEAGGVTTLPSGVQPDAAAHASLLTEHQLHVAALCSGRDATPELQQEVVQALRDAGARRVYVAGASQDGAMAVGAERGVRDGDDMIGLLGELLDRFEEGPLQ
jgi:methylmalonyl-CoA mutase